MRPHINAGKWQLLWWGRWVGFGSFGQWPSDPDSHGWDKPIYDLRVGLGLAELRRFVA
jgi:hypothetical protein